MHLNQATVLLVDDEPMLLELMSKWFEREKCRVLTAENGMQALQKIMSDRVHVIVSDVRMPVMDGYALVNGIKGNHIYRPSVIFVSGFHDIPVRASYDMGVEASFPKPVRREELISTVRRILMDRSELWSSPLVGGRAPSLEAALGSVSQAVEQGLIAFGRGGFCFQTEVLHQEGLVRLAIDFERDQQSIRGEGHVRWCCTHEGRMGVEITALEPSCREWVHGLTQANPTLSYIPANTASAASSTTQGVTV
jgi:CheY-like chemotaxis protein